MDEEKKVPQTIEEWQRAVAEHCKSKGWDNGFDASNADAVLAKLMLVVTEVAEAAEDVRTGAMQTTEEGEKRKPVGYPTELVDIVIRVLHLAALTGVDMQAEMARKHAFNQTRPMRHGGLRA